MKECVVLLRRRGSSIRVGSSCRVAPIVPDHVPINVARSFVLEIPQHLLSLGPPTLADSA